MGSDPSSSHKPLLVLLLSWDQHFMPSCSSSLSKIILHLKGNSPLMKFAKSILPYSLRGKLNHRSHQSPLAQVSSEQGQTPAFHFRDQFPVTWGQCHQPHTQRQRVWSRANFSNSPPSLAQPQGFASYSPSEAGGISVLTQPWPAWHCRLWLCWLCFHGDSSLLRPDQVLLVLLKKRHPLRNQEKRSRLTKFCSQRPWNCWNFCDISNCALPTALRTFPKTERNKKRERKEKDLN